MSKYQKGTNRQRIHDLLDDKPVTADHLCLVTGISKSAVNSVLGQIGALGDAVSVINNDGVKCYKKGNGKPASKPKKSKPKINGKTKREEINNYLIANVGNEITLESVARHFKLKSKSMLRGMLNDKEAMKHLTIIVDRPRKWRIEPAILGKSLAVPEQELIPKPSVPVDPISQLQIGLQRLVPIYIELGATLQALGLVESE